MPVARSGTLVSLVLLLILNPPLAQTDALTAAETCGHKSAFSSMARLPSVRIVVFDPLSNSFAFVACAEGDTWNQDYLDRERLALPTQKIRLLVMPYDPFDGDLYVETTKGSGVEFEAVPIDGSPVRIPQGDSAVDPPPSDEPVEEEALVAVIPLPALARTYQTRDSIINDTPLPLVESRDEILAGIQGRFNAYSTVSLDAARAGRDFEKKAFEAASSIRGIPGAVTSQLGDRSFSLASDRSLAEIEIEATERRKAFGVRSIPDVPEQLSELHRAALDVEEHNTRLRNLADQIETELARASAMSPTKSRKEAQAALIKSYERRLKHLETDLASREASHLERMKTIDALQKRYDSILKALSSPATRLQRINYSPLPNGETMTIAIRRDATAPEAPTPMARVSSIQLRSAPAYVLRFAMGAVVSGLEKPSFKVSAPFDVPGEAVDDPSRSVKTILYDDRGDDRIVPGIFLHHSWGRRSPLLKPTRQEMFVPTLTLGIPLSESGLFEEVLVGLAWQLAPGFELSAGMHYGPTTTLGQDLKAGHTIPATVDLTTLLQKEGDHGYFAGITIHSEAFRRLIGADD